MHLDSKRLIFLSLSIFIFFPSIRVFYKYSGEYHFLFSILYFILTIVIYYKLIFNKTIFIEKIITNKILIFSLLLVMFLVVFNVYPIADALKDQMRGSDQDNCVIIGVQNLLNFENPYKDKSYYGNPCSTGVGVLVAYIPFVYFNIYSLGAPVFISIFAYFIYKYYNNLYSVASFLIFILSCVLLLELMVVGSDLVFIGMGIAFSSLMLIKALEEKSIKLIIITALIVGLIASTRINFLILIFLSSFYIFIHFRKATFMFLVLSSALALIPSVIIYLSNPEMFTPIHLIGKSSHLFTPTIRYIVIIINIMTFFYSLHLVKKMIKNINIAFFITLLPTLLSLSIADLIIFRSWNFAPWEGANYLIPLIPLAAIILLDLLNSTKKLNNFSKKDI